MSEAVKMIGDAEWNRRLNDFIQRWAGQKEDALTTTELNELRAIAAGVPVNESAIQRGVGRETVRGCRKRVYAKLDMSGSNDILASLLRFALEE